MREKPRVALIFGGEGREREVSIAGAKFVLPLLNREKYCVIPTYITESGEWRLLPDTPMLTRELTGLCAFPTRRGFATDKGFIKIDCAIPLLHGERGEDGIIQGLLDAAAIPYVGSGVTAGAVSMDKAFTKALADTLGIPTVPSYLVIEGSITHTPEAARIAAEEDFGYPMFIKPARQGSSFGAGVAKTREELDTSLRTAIEVGDGRVLIEKYIDNRVELECAYLGACGKQLFTPIGEITCRGFYDYDTKYKEDSEARVTPDSPHDARFGDTVREWSRLLVEYLGIRHLARLDFFLSGESLYFNEINTFPGFTESSLYQRLVAKLGISPREEIELFISDALSV